MHCIVGVLHTEEQDPDDFFSRFLYNNTDMFEEVESLSRQELVDLAIEEGYLQNDEYSDDELNNFVDDFGYEKDPTSEQERWVKYENPVGMCDWYEIGGRWENALVDYQGNKADSMQIKYIKTDKSIPELYAYVKAYEYDDTFYQEKTDLLSISCEALRWEVLNDEDLVLTLIDMHTQESEI